MITGQDLRKRLEDICTATLSEQWQVTRRTTIDNPGTYLAQIGHAIQHDPATYAPGSLAVQLIITLWVNEGNDAEAPDDLYFHLSRNDGSLYSVLCATTGVNVSEVGNVGLRDWGPTGFTAGDIVLTIRGS